MFVLSHFKKCLSVLFLCAIIKHKERFNTEHKALQEHISKLEKNKTYKNRNTTFSDVWERIKENSAKEESTITKYESILKHHIKNM